MPGRDRTGPRGMGPLTGRGMGFCSGAGAYPGRRQGFRPTRGGGAYGRGGRGWRHVYYATGLPGWARGCGFWGPPGRGFAWTAEEEYNDLRDYAASLEEELRATRERMEALTREQPQTTEG